MRRCPECHAEFRGRTDKKFCSDGCRNAYHNRQNRDCNNLLRTVNNRLRKNYRILRHLRAETHNAPIRRAQLADHGFDFETITRVRALPGGRPCYCVYNLGYVALGQDCVRIVEDP